MELRQLKTFRLVVATGSITQTAALLNYAQSSVTAQVQALEKELGVALFDRIGRNVQPTGAGRQLYAYATQILDLADQAQAVVSGSGAVEGVLTIGAPETVCTYRLPAVLRQYRSQNPKIQLSFRPMLDIDLFHGVKDGSLDVAFLLQEPLQAKGLLVECLVTEPLLVICASDHPLAGRDLVKPSDLEGETVLLTENGCGYRHLFEQSISREGIYSVVKLEFNSIEAIKQCVIAGLGIAFLPQVSVQQEISAGRLSAVRWEKSFTVYTQLIASKEKWLSPALEAFMQLSRDLLHA
jgi:DNA-binding transcriptional LysR family regulator